MKSLRIVAAVTVVAGILFLATSRAFAVVETRVAALSTVSAASERPAAVGRPPLGPNPSSSANELRSVDALSASDVWAVGWYMTDQPDETNTLIVHWDGENWSQVPSPNPSSTANELYSVSVRSENDAWAVGWYVDDATAVSNTLILRWDGSTWTQVPSPNPGASGNSLIGVSVNSADDVWAVGIQYAGAGGKGSLILHWDGEAWSKVHSPDVNGLHRVSAASTTDAWAVGVRSSEFLHWDGEDWTRVKSHSPRTPFVWGVEAESETNAWAVGSYTNAAGNADTLMLHWDGERWSQFKTPTAGRLLFGVSSARPGYAWAVGQSGRIRRSGTLIYRWDGTHWSRVDSPNPSQTSSLLWDVSARSATDAWAVGSFGDESAGVDRVLILHWDGVRWTVGS
jgi:hypothetical protein